MKRIFSIPFKRSVLLLFAFFLFVGASKAQDVATQFNEANKLYEQGKFSDAAARYQKILDAGSVSAPLYFNLGNAYLKSGELGRAIVAYERAKTLAPRDPEIQANLQFARNKAGAGATGKKDVTEKIIGKLTLNEWTVLTSITVALWFFALAIRQWRREWRTAFLPVIRALGVSAIILLACFGAAVANYFNASVVVIVPEAVVRQGPFDESQSAFTLHDGAEVNVLNRREEWLKIADDSGKTGWLRGKDVAESGSSSK